MPIVNINGVTTGLTQAVTPLSRYWTHEQVASEVMVLTNTIDNEFVQLDNIRNHINSCVSYLTNLLNQASNPWYGIYFQARFESTLHNGGFEYVDLTDSANANALDVYSVLDEIKRINILGNETNAFTGNVIKWDLAQIGAQWSQLNVQHRHTIAFVVHGREILFYLGSGITTPNKSLGVYDYIVNTSVSNLIVWGQRNCLLDNLIAPNITVAQNPLQNYRNKIDLPDKYVDLLIKMAMQKTLMQLREQVPGQLEQEINQGVANINSLIDSELRREVDDREKKKYGDQQRPVI